MLKRHEVLFNQLTEYRNEVLELAESVTEETADRIPEKFNNNIRWNMGHIYLDQWLWIHFLTKEKVPIPEGYQEWFGFGTSPKDWKTKPPSLNELKSLLKQQPEMIKRQFGGRLEEEFPPIEYGIHTVAQALERTIFHEGLHLEAIKAIKRFL